MRCVPRAGRRSMTPVSTPARRTASARSNWCAAPRSPKPRERTGRILRSAFRPCAATDNVRPSAQSRAMSKAFDQPAEREKADEQQAAAEVGGFQVVFRIPGRVSVGASEGAKSLRVSTASIAPDLAVRSVPVIDPTAFLEASFTQSEDAPLLPGRVAIYRDGVFIGRSHMAAAGKDETVRLGFGADDKVKV